MQSNIIIFTDGASSGNPGPGGWGAIISYNEQVTELGGFEKKTTNNRTELTAVYQALLFVLEQQLNSNPITLYTDSAYVANGVTTWIKGWQKRGWKNSQGESIANVDIWKNIADILPDIHVNIVTISGHSGILGNERADKIATGFIQNTKHFLYNGPKSQYDIDLEDIKMDTNLKQEKDRKKTKAYSYLSLVNKEIQVHKTWDTCKARVEGQKGAKYKKAISREDEDDIKKSWGIR